MMARVVAVALAATLLFVAAAQAYDATYEARNYAKINERATTDYTPAFNAQLAVQGAKNEASAASIIATDGPAKQYGRDFSGNLCANAMNGCAGDIRLYSWGNRGGNIVKPVLFTARNGSTLSGHVWMTGAGQATRPGVVITNGSVQAPETLYWYAAETLAENGYIVLTWDPQGQGYSDTFGEGTDRTDGFPSQTGEPFYDGTEDALDFFFSTPGRPYVPRPSCSSGTSHADKQAARVKDGRSTAYNPFYAKLDTGHVGIAGHSLGAAAVSYIGQLDPRVKAIVAWDNLNDVTAGGGPTCKSGSSKRPDALAFHVPALGMSADYYLTPEPYTSDPDASTIQGKIGGSLAASKAGVDTGQIMIRGGTHYEFSYIPNPAFGATRRGMDMVAWYTNAWMDKELKGDPTADGRLLTTRWQNDKLEGEVDDQTPPDPNLYSTYFPSRLDISLTAGGHFTCENLRKGCAGMALDPNPANYSFLDATGVNAPPAGSGPTGSTGPSGPTGPSGDGGSTTAPGGSTNTPPAETGPTAVHTVTKAGGCNPRSRVRRITHLRRHRLRLAGVATPSPACVDPIARVRLTFRHGRHHRTVTARGTHSWRITVRLKHGRYRVLVKASTRGGAVEGAKRKRHIRVA